MLYDLDMEMRVERRRTQRALIATLDQRENFLRVLSAYHSESLSDGYGSAHPPGRNAKARDRARAYQLWEHGVINVSTLRKIFPVTRRTLNVYWGVNSSGDPRLRLWGSLNPEHIPYLLDLIQLRRSGGTIALQTEAMSYLTGTIDPHRRTTLSLAANLLGLNLRGQPLPDVGLDEVPATPSTGEAPRPVVRPTPPAPADPVHAQVPGQTTIEEHVAAATHLDDPQVRTAVELGEQAFAPDMGGFDDTGDEALQELDENEFALSGVGEDVYEGDPARGERS